MNAAAHIHLLEFLWFCGDFFGGMLVACWFLRWKDHQLQSERKRQGEALIEEARREADAILRTARLAANEEALALRERAESALSQRGDDLRQLEERLGQRESLINQQLEGLVKQEQLLREHQGEVGKKEEALAAELAQLKEVVKARRTQLSNLSGLSESAARNLLIKELKDEALRDAGDLTRHIIDEAKTRAEEEARRIISLAIQRYAGEHTFETTTATVALLGEEIKGRIIGREGRNIRAFEGATGVTVLIDDTPNAVVLSGFDPVRREIARQAMERLIEDGRIHPSRIEEVVAKVTQEMDESIVRNGEEAVFELGLAPLHLEVTKLLGRLKFRRSFTQNILDHSIEVAYLSGLMAAELGLDTTIARRAGLLHDIGKAVTHEIEGSHAMVGADILKRYGESPQVVDGVASHHDEVPHVGVWGILVGAADAISAARPGARSETMTTYLKRLEDLETIGLSFPGVEKCFAVQAGRELRVIVHPDQIKEEEAFELARNIVRKIEEQLQYPGQIRITVIRETRVVEFAK